MSNKKLDDLTKNLNRLEEKVNKRLGKDKYSNGKKSKISLHGPAFRIVAEMLAGLIFGLMTGWFFTKQMGAPDFVFVLCLILGLIGGFYGVIKMIMKPPKTSSSKPDDNNKTP